MPRPLHYLPILLILALSLSACDDLLDALEEAAQATPSPAANIQGETALVVNIIDGDTIDVQIDGRRERVRYIGVNTPERDEACYQEASRANANLVEGKRVTLVQDVSDRDQYGRLLRHIYVDGLHVNAELLRLGYAETVRYPPDISFFDAFRELEQAATRANLGCHPTGIFDDDTYNR